GEHPPDTALVRHGPDQQVNPRGASESGYPRFQGSIGLPCHTVLAGTWSPRMTSEAGPTVAPSPMRAAGSTTECAARVAPSAMVTVSRLITRSWNRCVCTTVPGPTVAPRPTTHRSVSGNQ